MNGTFEVSYEARRQMRLMGVANPMDVGQNMDSDSGSIASSHDVRKRARDEVLQASSRGRGSARRAPQQRQQQRAASMNIQETEDSDGDGSEQSSSLGHMGAPMPAGGGGGGRGRQQQQFAVDPFNSAADRRGNIQQQNARRGGGRGGNFVADDPPPIDMRNQQQQPVQTGVRLAPRMRIIPGQNPNRFYPGFNGGGGGAAGPDFGSLLPFDSLTNSNKPRPPDGFRQDFWRLYFNKLQETGEMIPDSGNSSEPTFNDLRRDSAQKYIEKIVNPTQELGITTLQPITTFLALKMYSDIGKLLASVEYTGRGNVEGALVEGFLELEEASGNTNADYLGGSGSYLLPPPFDAHGRFPEPMKDFMDRSSVFLIGGIFLTGETIVHLVRWPQLFSISEELFFGVIESFDARLDVCVLRHMLGLITSSDSEASAHLISDYIYSAGMTDKQTVTEVEEYGLTKPYSLGRSIREALWELRTVMKEMWIREPDRDAFFNMRFGDWVGGLWSLVSPYCKGESMVSLINSSGKESAWIEKYRLMVYETPQVFFDRIFHYLRPDILHLDSYRDILERSETHYDLYRNAQQMDQYYAELVKGACPSMAITKFWAPVSTNAPPVLDDKMFVDVIWNIIKRIQPVWMTQTSASSDFYSSRSNNNSGLLEGGNAGREALETVRRMKEIRDAMVDIWHESRMYRVTPEVHTVEIQVLHRLKQDREIPWFDSGTDQTCLKVLEVCNWFRRSDLVRSHFAAAVGRRLASEGLVVTSNSSIMNHKRMTSWAEREYLALYSRVCEIRGEIQEACVTQDTKRAQEAMFVDYLGLQVTFQSSEFVFLFLKLTRRVCVCVFAE